MKRYLMSVLTGLLLVAYLAPAAIAAYQAPFTFGALTGDVTSTGNNSYVTKVVSYNGGTPFGSMAGANVGYELGWVNLATGATYNVGSSDSTICVNKTTGSATSIVLPTVTSGNRRVRVKDCKGDAATNNITVTSSSGNIDGQSSYTLTVNRQANEFNWDGANWEIF